VQVEHQAVLLQELTSPWGATYFHNMFGAVSWPYSMSD